MADDPLLNSYLDTLDKALGQVPASSRAEIVLEIRSHVLDAQEMEPGRSTKSILASLGEAEAVANRYLLERGLKAGKPPRGAVAKWLTIGFLGTVALLLLATGAVLWRFQPLVEVNGDEGSIKVLGGLITVQDDNGDDSVDGDQDHQQPVNLGKTTSLRIESANSKLTITPSSDTSLHWSCKGHGSAAVTAKEEGNSLVLPLASMPFTRCKVAVPKSLSTRIESANGKILISRPASNFDISLANGKVVLDPDPTRPYTYELQATNGSVDSFVSTASAEALKIKVSVANGKIVRERT